MDYTECLKLFDRLFSAGVWIYWNSIEWKSLFFIFCVNFPPESSDLPSPIFIVFLFSGTPNSQVGKIEFPIVRFRTRFVLGSGSSVSSVRMRARKIRMRESPRLDNAIRRQRIRVAFVQVIELFPFRPSIPPRGTPALPLAVSLPPPALSRHLFETLLCLFSNATRAVVFKLARKIVSLWICHLRYIDISFWNING